MIIVFFKLLKIFLQTSFFYIFPKTILGQKLSGLNCLKFSEIKTEYFVAVSLGLLFMEIFFYVVQKKIKKNFPIKNKINHKALQQVIYNGYFATIIIYRGLYNPLFAIFIFVLHLVLFFNNFLLTRKIGFFINILFLSAFFYFIVYYLGIKSIYLNKSIRNIQCIGDYSNPHFLNSYILGSFLLYLYDYITN